jgi:glycosyltransferase involved in cell wall biosynthesis
VSERSRRIAVILSEPYRGGTLRGAKLVAEALWSGSLQAGEEADVVLGYPERPGDWEEDLAPAIATRAFEWKILDAATAARAMHYAGHRDWEPSATHYLTPEDNMRQFGDCDLWLIVSDRLRSPLLPLRKYVLLAYDYVQRYDPVFRTYADDNCIEAARAAARVFTTTRFTEQGALAYAGIPREKVVRLPMLMPDFGDGCSATAGDTAPYFIWTTNRAPHKNHENAARALENYYAVLDGQLECHITGALTNSLLSTDLPQLKTLARIASECEPVSAHLRVLGELPEPLYRRELAGAAFLWHPARVDNGTFSVVEAAAFHVPSLSSRYPAMEEIDAEFGLHLSWMDPRRPEDMARKLKWMEMNAASARDRLPSRRELMDACRFAPFEYWGAIRKCL